MQRSDHEWRQDLCGEAKPKAKYFGFGRGWVRLQIGFQSFRKGCQRSYTETANPRLNQVTINSLNSLRERN
jgi:hypothetical protein